MTSNPITAARIRFLWHCATIVANDLQAELEQAGNGDTSQLKDQFNRMADVYSILEHLALSYSSANLVERPKGFEGFMPIDPTIEQKTKEILAIAEME